MRACTAGIGWIDVAPHGDLNIIILYNHIEIRGPPFEIWIFASRPMQNEEGDTLSDDDMELSPAAQREIYLIIERQNKSARG